MPFFVIAAATALLLYWPAPDDMRWVPLALAVVYLVLAVLTALDQWSRSRSSR